MHYYRKKRQGKHLAFSRFLLQTSNLNQYLLPICSIHFLFIKIKSLSCISQRQKRGRTKTGMFCVAEWDFYYFSYSNIATRWLRSCRAGVCTRAARSRAARSDSRCEVRHTRTQHMSRPSAAKHVVLAGERRASLHWAHMCQLSANLVGTNRCAFPKRRCSTQTLKKKRLFRAERWL